jgi:phosphate transport system substrate-binding protein
VKLYRIGATAALIVGALALSACGSSSKSGGSTTSSADTGAATSAGSSSASTAAVTCASGSLKADGSTAQANAMAQWIKDYQAKCPGATVAYAGGGSGQGVTDFIGKQVDFAGSDAALSPTKGEPAKATAACGSTALDLPMVTGPIALAYKVNGVSDLTLTPVLIAKIFQGTITTWNDPAIKAANPSANLPSTKISVFFRSDQSGTTQNFETYLSKADPADYTATPSKVWSGKVGQGKSGSQGVQQGIQGADGSIGYLEWSFAVNGNLDTAKVDNGGGAVDLTADAAGKTVADATVVGTGDDLSLNINYATKAPGAYPIVLVTYEIVCTKYANATQGALVKSFLTYTSGAGQAGLPDLGYAPLPATVLAKVQAVVAKIS